jgi:hypothetical protein
MYTTWQNNQLLIEPLKQYDGSEKCRYKIVVTLSLSIKFFFCKANIVIFVSIKDFLCAILAIHAKQINSSLYYSPNKCSICIYIRRYITIISNSKKFTLCTVNKCTMCTGSIVPLYLQIKYIEFDRNIKKIILYL